MTEKRKRTTSTRTKRKDVNAAVSGGTVFDIGRSGEGDRLELGLGALCCCCLADQSVNSCDSFLFVYCFSFFCSRRDDLPRRCCDRLLRRTAK